MKSVVNMLCLFLVALISSCKENSEIDVSKLDSDYFVGAYKTNYRDESEEIILKLNGKYDYIHFDDSVIVRDAGSWRINKDYLYVYLSDFPNLRSRKVYNDKGQRFDIMLNIDVVNDLGDLFTQNYEEGYYTFVKLDKTKNYKYIKR